MYYISFDPFSLLDQKFNIFCKEGESSQRLISISIAEAISNSEYSLESLYGRVTSPPSTNIGDVLLHLRSQHAFHFVHFLVDEFNQELFTKLYASTLHYILEDLDNFLYDSTVVIALQSVFKNRTIRSAGHKNMHQFVPIDLENYNLKIIQLKTCARMTHQLYKLQLNLQKEVEENPFTATLSFQGKLTSKMF